MRGRSALPTTVMPSSSLSSRLRATSGDSPGSTLPPGNSQRPARRRDAGRKTAWHQWAKQGMAYHRCSRRGHVAAEAATWRRHLQVIHHAPARLFPGGRCASSTSPRSLRSTTATTSTSRRHSGTAAASADAGCDDAAAATVPGGAAAMKVIDCRAVGEVTAALWRRRLGGVRLQQAAMQCLDVAASKGRDG